MSVFITGVAGFIGSQVARALLARGERVIGVDNFSDYYDPVLKFARLKSLQDAKAFTFLEGDVSDRNVMMGLVAKHRDIDGVIHLAAQPGIRHSGVDPYIYVQSNVMGHLVILEAARQLGSLKHFVYASSSSVYGSNRELPFSVDDRVDNPVSLYAATKRSDELISEAYGHLHQMNVTGLRYFTVYGPWGRPDMSPYIFAKAIYKGTKIQLFHHGSVKRAYSFIDDIVDGTLAVLDRPDPATRHRIYNLGAAKSESIIRLVELLECAIGRKADVELKPGERDDVLETAADITQSMHDLGWAPQVPMEEGVPKFVEWFRSYHGL